MNLKAALLATATASACFLIAACGGGGTGSDSGNSDSSVSGSSGNNSNVSGSSGNNSSGTSTGTRAQFVALDLHSSGYSWTNGTAIGDGVQAGTGYKPSPNPPGWYHALLWRGSASTVVDLHPTQGWDGSAVTATSGGIQVGWGQHDDNRTHALKWAGSASSVVDIHPDAIVRYSWALGVSGDQIVGWGEVPDVHALLWTSGGVVDLNPSKFSSCMARATDGAQQVGNCGGHAMMWSGRADSAIDLHPIQYCWSLALGVSSGQQVGMGGCDALGRDEGAHALLWMGSAQSVVDLHPSGFRDSVAVAVTGGQQVGWGTTTDGSSHAILWNSTADSVVDLHQFLPPGFSRSAASGIDASGNIVGTADGHAILWLRQSN